ncbi:Uncharacterized [Syntrophomonas zehnderi OL-4]|uniref:Uncharacterized n=1 Tax=Syntrophomonas zehnderi OL-4 TaxID=690567 RepID=A0A0E4C7I5_9FIRM|nr:hypothetical protein [Syntrophomonas zehnderi]CFW99774.1 Uncharacterized [Syntrophomonas zehnderi OL-4]
MTLQPVEKQFSTGDLVVLKSSRRDERYCIIGFKHNQEKQQVAILKALYNETYIIEKPVSELNTLLIKGKL